MNHPKHRREFLRQMALYTMGAGMFPTILSACNTGSSTKESKDSVATAVVPGAAEAKALFFKISLAEWSFHESLFSGKLSHLDFPLKAKKEFGIEAVEYVNQFFKDKAKDKSYLADLKKRCSDNGVRSVLIMCDGEGEMGDQDAKK